MIKIIMKIIKTIIAINYFVKHTLVYKSHINHNPIDMAIFLMYSIIIII